LLLYVNYCIVIILMKYLIAPNQSASIETGFVLPSHLAADIDDAMGDRADVISAETGLPVYTYVRPGTGTLPAIDKLESIDDYLDSIKKQAHVIKQQFNEYGVDKMILVGNSAGGIDAIALAASGILNVTQLIVMEPVATREVDKVDGLRYFKSQQDKTREELYDPEFDSLPNIPAIRKSITRPEIIRRSFKEIKAYNHVFSSDLGLHLLRGLVTDRPEVPIDLFLGARSLATTETTRANMEVEFEGTSLNLEIFPGGQHSFPNKLNFFVHIIKRAMARVQDIPNLNEA
jgi:pimeloyl-ACP methyl ester carboxylesterase